MLNVSKFLPQKYFPFWMREIYFFALGSSQHGVEIRMVGVIDTDWKCTQLKKKPSGFKPLPCCRKHYFIQNYKKSIPHFLSQVTKIFVFIQVLNLYVNIDKIKVTSVFNQMDFRLAQKDTEGTRLAASEGAPAPPRAQAMNVSKKFLELKSLIERVRAQRQEINAQINTVRSDIQAIHQQNELLNRQVLAKQT